MIKSDEISRIWKRTVTAIIIVTVVAIFILGSFVKKRIEGSGGPAIYTTITIFAVLIVFSLTLYFVSRIIKNRIAARFGEESTDSRHNL